MKEVLPLAVDSQFLFWELSTGARTGWLTTSASQTLAAHHENLINLKKIRSSQPGCINMNHVCSLPHSDTESNLFLKLQFAEKTLTLSEDTTFFPSRSKPNYISK